MASSINLQLHTEVMVAGKILMIRPVWALAFGSVTAAVLYAQLLYRAGGVISEGGVRVRFSYTKLQQQLPFLSRRWIVETVRRLEDMKAVVVIRGSQVNEFELPPNTPLMLGEIKPQQCAAMTFSPDLAVKVGLLDAIFLQQIHLRHCIYDGSVWVIKSFKQWHSDVFMFLGIATVKRVFARLEARNLIFVSTYQSERGVVNKYRVNYLRIAESLGVKPPSPYVPEDPKKLSEWINPLYPIGQPNSEHATGLYP